MYQARDWQLQLLNDCVLFFNLHSIRFDQRIPKFCYILISYALSVQRIKTNPCPCRCIIISQHASNVTFTFCKFLDELSCSSGVVSFVSREIFSFFLPAFYYISNDFRWIIQCFKISDNLRNRIPVLRLSYFSAFNPSFIHNNQIILLTTDFIIPV